MDHLPYPKVPNNPHIQIPLLCSSDVTPWGLTAGPRTSDEQRYEFVKRRYVTPILAVRDAESRATRIQQDIYFGFLTGFLGVSKIDPFLCNEGGTSNAQVSLKRLEGILLDTYKIHGDVSPHEIDLLADFRCTIFVLNLRLIDENKPSLMESPNLQKILMSVDILIWTLAAFFFYAYEPFHKPILLKNRMIESGWCPYWAEILFDAHPTPLLYYLSALAPVQEATPQCSKYSCNCNNSCPLRPTRHAGHCMSLEGCRLYEPATLQVEEIVRNNGIALVEITPPKPATVNRDIHGNGEAQDSNNFVARLVSYQPEMTFAAVSHVWSGELGSKCANAIPECHLKSLYDAIYIAGDEHRRVQTADDVSHCYWQQRPLRIWMDTLCIPACECMHPKNNTGQSDRTVTCVVCNPRCTTQKAAGHCSIKAAAKRALSSMEFIYTAAENVLALDIKVQNLVYDKVADIDIATTMLCCPWMQRSWTFQESCLSREVWFLLRDRLISPRRWHGRWKSYFVHVPSPHETALWDPGIFPKDRSETVLEMRLKFECLRFVRGICGFNEGSLLPADFEDYDIEKEHAGLIDPIFEIIGDTFGKTEGNSRAFFAHVWNHLSVRRTTFKEDLHTMMAILFGLHVDEVYGREKRNTQNGSHDQKLLKSQETNVAQDPHPTAPTKVSSTQREPGERMLAILLSQDSLPLRMLLFNYLPGTALSERHPWIPHYPELFHGDEATGIGVISQSYDDGEMTLSPNLLGWEWSPKETQSILAVLRNPGQETLADFCLGGPEGAAEQDITFHINVSLEPPAEKFPAIPEHSHLCLYLHKWQRVRAGRGACLLAVDLPPWGENTPTLNVQFICPVRWSDHSPQDSAHHAPVINGWVSFDEMRCLLLCGMAFYLFASLVSSN